MKMKNIKSPKKEITFYLYRHGETDWNLEKRIKGHSEDSNINFTNKGLTQIYNIAQLLSNENIDAIFTSDLKRTRKTAQKINKPLGLPLLYFKNFRGLNMGQFEGKCMIDFSTCDEINNAFKDHNIKIPGGESINDLIERFLNGLQTIANNYHYNKVAIISHRGAISNLKSKIAKSTYEDIDFCVIKYHNNTFTIVNFGKYNF